MKRLARGFTLVEVLVAVAVVAITLGAGLRAAGTLIDNAQRLSDVIAAQWCAENHLANLKLTRQFPGAGETSFACEQLGRSYTVKVLTSVSTRNPNFRRADVQVFDDAGRPMITLITVLSRY